MNRFAFVAIAAALFVAGPAAAQVQSQSAPTALRHLADGTSAQIAAVLPADLQAQARQRIEGLLRNAQLAEAGDETLARSWRTRALVELYRARMADTQVASGR